MPISRFTAEPWGAFADRDGWDALAGSAAEPNPFAERWCLAAGLAGFDAAQSVQLGSFTQHGRLAGIIPLAHAATYARRPLPHLTSWTHANVFCGAPLVARGAQHAFWQALLAWADSHAGRALFLHLPHLPTDGATYAALRDVCAAEGRRAAVVHSIDRALLASDLGPEEYFAQSMSAKKRKELRRQLTRLGELGTVRFERLTDGAGLDEWIAAFLALEAAGWKGRQGSALACAADTEAFFRAALAGAAQAGRLERLACRVDDRPVAMLVNFVTPPGVFSFKTAFDEAFARFSPGVLLQRENLALLARADIAWADSCAAADHPMIERIWHEKRTIARVSVPIGGALRRSLAHLLLRAETGAFPKGL